MTQPKTLLEMAGMKPAPPPLGEAALLLIDMQREYVDGALALPGAQPALAEAAKLVARVRKAGRPVVHVQHRGRAGGLFDPDGPRFAIDGAVAPQGDEPVVQKPLPNSFAKTELQEVLDRLGVKHLIVGGFMTHMCVSSTVRAALDLGYGCTVIGAACATRDLPDGQGGVIAADQLHRAELVALSDRFATVLKDAAAAG